LVLVKDTGPGGTRLEEEQVSLAKNRAREAAIASLRVIDVQIVLEQIVVGDGRRAT
jgi:hypothetical protein